MPAATLLVSLAAHAAAAAAVLALVDPAGAPGALFIDFTRSEIGAEPGGGSPRAAAGGAEPGGRAPVSPAPARPAPAREPAPDPEPDVPAALPVARPFRVASGSARSSAWGVESPAALPPLPPRPQPPTAIGEREPLWLPPADQALVAGPVGESREPPAAGTASGITTPGPSPAAPAGAAVTGPSGPPEAASAGIARSSVGGDPIPGAGAGEAGSHSGAAATTIAAPAPAGAGDGRPGALDHAGGSAGEGGSGLALGRGPGPAAAAIPPGVSAEPGTEYSAYLADLRRRIQDALRYPAAARRRGLAGTVQLEIVIDRAGAIREVSVAGSSSHPLLDEAALETVRTLRPAPFPADLVPRRLRVRLPIVFALE